MLSSHSVKTKRGRQTDWLTDGGRFNIYRPGPSARRDIINNSSCRSSSLHRRPAKIYKFCCMDLHICDKYWSLSCDTMPINAVTLNSKTNFRDTKLFVYKLMRTKIQQYLLVCFTVWKCPGSLMRAVNRAKSRGGYSHRWPLWAIMGSQTSDIYWGTNSIQIQIHFISRISTYVHTLAFMTKW